MLRYKVKNATAKEVTLALESTCQSLLNATTLDKKLADYAFFPLCFVFRESKALPSRATEIALDCLQVLIERGWRQETSVEVCKQLLILFSILCVDDTTDGLKKDAAEGISIAAMRCINSLCLYAGNAVSALVASQTADIIPVLGHVISVILTSANEASAVELQVQAMQALIALESSLTEDRVLRSFLPGIVSGLTKILQPTTKSRRSYRVLEHSLQAMTIILQKTLGNHVTTNDANSQTEDTQNENDSWIATTSAQVKMALANIVGLRYHQKTEILEAIFLMCMKVVDDCSDVLGNCTSLMLETLACICCQDADVNIAKRDLSAMQRLLDSHVDLPDILRASAYDWISALPRVMLSTDDVKRARHIRLIITTYRILSCTNCDLSTLDRELAGSLQESTTASIKQAWNTSIQAADPCFPEVASLPNGLSLSKLARQFDSSALLSISQKDSLQDISVLVEAYESTIPSGVIKKQLAETIQGTKSDNSLACLFLSSRLFINATKKAMEIDEFLSYESSVDGDTENFMEVVYSYGVNVLSETAIEDDGDWRRQAMALEIVAWQSSYAKLYFQSELVDILYPVLERIGSRNALLREYAMTCLNMITRSCGFHSSRELVVQNADYLVNAIALKLNTFEISPQAPRVLSMMVQLCGPTLFPYLDDIVESVFAALACFHGYPRLAESLFEFLCSVVDVASNTSPLTIKSPGLDHQKMHQAPTSVGEVAALLQKRTSRMKLDANPALDTASGSDPVPNVPWETLNVSGNTGEEIGPEEGKGHGAGEQKPRSVDKTYSMVQSIVRLGQHYLTQESPKLRLWLLQLTSSGCNALASNEDEFLPLINDVWPVVVKRLYDPESYICIAANETLAKIFQTAGDFVSSRVELEWPEMRDLYQRTHAQIKGAKTGKGSLGTFTSANQIWEALLNMFIALIMYVRMEAETQDQLMEMLGPLVNTRQDIRMALEGLNADSLWLQLLLEHRNDGNLVELETPSMQGFSFTKIAA